MYSGFLSPKPEITPMLFTCLLSSTWFTIRTLEKIDETVDLNDLKSPLNLQTLPIPVFLSNTSTISNPNIFASDSFAPPSIISQFECIVYVGVLGVNNGGWCVTIRIFSSENLKSSSLYKSINI